MSCTLRPVDPDVDAELIHGWVTAPRAVFWGMTDRSVEEVAWVYTYIGDQPNLAAYLLLLGDTPVGLAQTYDPAVDEIGRHYERRPGDLGLHLLLADDPARAGHTDRILEFLVDWAFADSAVQRIVLEPDVRNAPSLALFERIGATLGPRTTLTGLPGLPDKEAQFAFIARPDRGR
ncbi:GNAT family N-acetyltransferase [Nocardioides sp.]|uniref:GNAT family N-acetyltransferase n=1 Tax=Nocardioides sp. TaxID=35761 RepID=UPI00273708AB|nr:GNAT family N-acetyltransferase [Nocardioides sp.]MDP3889668.1 GNAT family N-acetyltransferase [Nocardioides sp.]